MKEEKLLKLFREIFTEVPTNEIVLDAEFKEWEQYSSLTMMILVDKISTEFDRWAAALRPFRPQPCPSGRGPRGSHR